MSFDLHLPETEAAMQATAHLEQVSCYDLAWASTVAKRSWQQLHETLVADGKGQWFDELKPFVAGPGAVPPNQEEAAARKGKDARFALVDCILKSPFELKDKSRRLIA